MEEKNYVYLDANIEIDSNILAPIFGLTAEKMEGNEGISSSAEGDR